MPVTSLGTWHHLAGRFLSVLLAKALQPPEVDEIRIWLSPGERAAFFAQPPYDQRHGLDSARFIAELGPQRRDLVRAALLHDIGKRHSQLGPIGRSLASAYAKFGGKASGRWVSYLQHGRAGGAELKALGSEPMVVEFAEHHHGLRPGSITQADWDLLQAADRV